MCYGSMSAGMKRKDGKYLEQRCIDTSAIACKICKLCHTHLVIEFFCDLLLALKELDSLVLGKVLCG